MIQLQGWEVALFWAMILANFLIGAYVAVMILKAMKRLRD